MDFSFSPDIDARICYLIVLLCALFAAYRQVERRLTTYPGSWKEWPTWLLYTSYVAVPVGLFWLLDRTSAINDTSAVAAVIVGVGYERILSGQSQPGLPASLAGFWTPFSAFADSISARVSKRIADRIFRFDRLLLTDMADPTRFDTLKQLARSLTRTLPALDKKIDDLEANRKVLGDRLTQEKQAFEFYAEVAQAPRWLQLLREAQAITETTYRSYPSDSGVAARAFEVSLPIAFVALAIISGVLVDSEYRVWRLAKANATLTDQWRTREALGAYFTDPPATLSMTRRISRILRSPILKVGQADLAIQTLLSGAKRAKQIPLVGREITDALRVPVVDNRTRLHSALLYLAHLQTGTDPCGTPAALPAQLCNWKPTDGDSIVDLEDRIDRWTAFWAVPPASSPAPAKI
jgi:hypothetical protein